MNKILIIDPGKGWGHFVSKMYCYQKLAECLGSKIIFLTKKSTQAEHYLNEVNFCDKVIYLDEPKKGIKNLIFNFKSFINNINKINKLEIEDCFVFHPSLRYLMIAKFSKISNIWSLGKKFQNFFIDSNRKLYSNFFSKTIANDNEALEFVKKITNSQNINFKPLLSNKNNYPNTIGIIIAASGIEKRWSIENYFKVINFLIEKI